MVVVVVIARMSLVHVNKADFADFLGLAGSSLNPKPPKPLNPKPLNP